MSDIPDCQDITDDSVAVAVDCVNVLLDVILNHGALKLGTLIGIETHIICILIEIQGCHIQLSGSAAGWLTVKPYQWFVLVSHFCAAFSCCCLGCGFCCCLSGGITAGGCCCRCFRWLASAAAGNQ